MDSGEKGGGDCATGGHAMDGRRRFVAMLVPLAILLLLFGAVAGNSGLRGLLAEAFHRIDPRAVLVTLPLQLAAILLCAAAQQALKIDVPFRASFLSRLTRDAGHNLLIFPPGLGEAIGARMLVLAGGRARAALSLRALDIAAETIAELPYMGIAFFVLWRFWGRADLPGLSMPQGLRGWLPVAAAAVLAAVLIGARRWWKRHGRAHRFARRVRAEWHLMRRELGRQKAGLPLAVLLHFIAWGLSAMQVWLASMVFGMHLGPFGALAIESAASSARVILFFVPGGLVMQEAGAVLAGMALGVPQAEALALSLVLRLRDVTFGGALLLWPLMEYRQRYRGRPARGSLRAGAERSEIPLSTEFRIRN